MKPEASQLPLHVLAACYFGMIFDGLDASIFGLTLHPCLSELLKTNSNSEIGVHGSIVMATFMFGWTAGAILFGMLADRVGRTKTLFLTVVLYALCSGLCATSHTWIELAFYRFLVGMGIGGEISIGGVMVAEAWRGNARLHATGLLQTGFSVGFLILGTINFFLGNYGWRWLYIIGTVPAALALYIRLRLSDSEDAKLVRKYRIQLESGSVSPQSGSCSPQALPCALPGDHETRLMKLPIVELFMPENRHPLIVLVALASTVCIGSFAVLSWLPAWINQICGHLAVNERSTAVVLQNVGAIFGAATGGIFVIRFGRKWSFRIAFLGALICTMALFLSVKSFGIALLLWTILCGFFVLAPYTYLFIYVPELFDTRLRATAFGFSIQCGRIFAGLANILGGQLVALFGGSFSLAAAVVSLIYVPGLIATLFMPVSSGTVAKEMES